MDAASVNILIGCISAFATVVAAIIYYWTLKELRKQRANTYRPHLFIDYANFRVVKPPDDKLSFPSFWINTTKKEASDSDDSVRGSLGHLFPLYLKCYNIGFGTAKKVKIKFSYDINFFVDHLKSLEIAVPEELKIKFNYEGNFISIGSLPSSNSSGEAFMKMDAFLESYISYVLPVQISNKPSDIPLPQHFLELMNIYAHYFVNVTSDKRDLVQAKEFNTPIITADIEYMDNANQKFHSKFSIVTQLIMGGHEEYFGRFEVSERGN